MPGNDEPLLTIGHYNVSALSRNVIPQLFKNANSVSLIYPRNLRHD
jgi:hypothetical protein